METCIPDRKELMCRKIVKSCFPESSIILSNLNLHKSMRQTFGIEEQFASSTKVPCYHG
ncbi:hypothetical protein PVAP13_9KG292278 [Panicum virgatum]|uniref:Uncharacterized protein n=1 Tax=Panicum virgatum TaxID=38727 RepID=A0A8T0NIK7_PANVG|nr:hypothetical protein PVAP13_9KG292278 [Panicum virgatum]